MWNPIFPHALTVAVIRRCGISKSYASMMVLRTGAWIYCNAMQKGIAASRCTARKIAGLVKPEMQEYIVLTGNTSNFVDSDDMLEPDALLYAYEKAKAEKLDVFAFDAHAVFDSAEMETEKGAYRTYYPRPDRYRDITPGEVFFTRQILDGKFIMQACCQLIKRKFLLKSGVRFIPGILQEDNAFTVELLLHAQRVSHENRPFYIRRVRPGSIMTRKLAFANSYGYFRCVEALIPYIDETSYQQETRKALQVFIQSFIHNMKRIYDSISAEERKKFMDLTAAENRAMGRLLLCSESVDFSKKE